jgi:hypothetical protein
MYTYLECSIFKLEQLFVMILMKGLTRRENRSIINKSRG